MQCRSPCQKYYFVSQVFWPKSSYACRQHHGFISMATCTLTIASQNVGLGAGQRIGRNAASSLAREDADLLCMQEGRPLHNGEFEDNGSMIELNVNQKLLNNGPYLARLQPGVEGHSVELPLYRPDDLTAPEVAQKYASRTFQQVTVYRGGFTIIVLNVHCRCGRAMDTALEFRKVALRRVKEYAERILLDGNAHATVIAGDFNLSDTDAAAVFSGSSSSSSWMVEYIGGGWRGNGQRFLDVLAFSTSVADVGADRVTTGLGHGQHQLSDVHGAGKLRLTMALPKTRWTRYMAAVDGGAYWWAKGDPQTDEVLDYFMEETAAAQGWSLAENGGAQMWSKGREFFYVSSGCPFLV